MTLGSSAYLWPMDVLRFPSRVFLRPSGKMPNLIHRVVAVCTLALSLLLPLTNLAAEPTAPAPDAKATSTLDELTVIRSNIELIAQLRRQGVEVDAEGSIARRLLADATRLTGGKVDSLEKLQAATGTAPTPQERKQGWFTFVNVMWFAGALLVVVALALLFGHYLARLIKQVPVEAWEVVAYLVCAGAIASGQLMPQGYALAPVLPGCLGLVGCLYFSKQQHHFRLRRSMIWLFVLVWGATALFYHNETIGFLTVVAALAGLGFYAAMIPGVVFLGFRSSEIIAQTTLAAGAMLVAHVALHCLGANPVMLAPFRSGMGFLGAFVYLLGLLIISNLRYARRNWPPSLLWPRYITMQVLTIASGVATMYFGSVYGVPTLLGIGGTFFYLYLLEKYYELPWRGVGWAWSLLGAGCLLYGFALFARAQPEWFFFMR